jgi:hypothetical protein
LFELYVGKPRSISFFLDTTDLQGRASTAGLLAQRASVAVRMLVWTFISSFESYWLSFRSWVQPLIGVRWMVRACGPVFPFSTSPVASISRLNAAVFVMGHVANNLGLQSMLIPIVLLIKSFFR